MILLGCRVVEDRLWPLSSWVPLDHTKSCFSVGATHQIFWFVGIVE